MAEPSTRCCDLVMKGGITSGVVFPGAVGEIAKKFHLVGIGGTSAGAIAACLAAAAEFRRRQDGSMAGFERLEAIARELGDGGRLLQLFRPDRDTRRLFEKVRGFQSGESGLGTIAGLWLRRKKHLGLLTANRFGLCSGMANGNPGEAPALTEWLAREIDEIAGKTGAPLTFEDLHGAPVPPGALGEVVAAVSPGRSIDLRCVTTCVTFGRPFEFPLSTGIFGFDPSEWSQLFPRRIVDHLVREGEAVEDSTLREAGKLPLALDRLPVVVAARMSLSFPVLFSMVPLWSRNFHDDGDPLRRVWFSDGGLTSNFPLHRFDALHPVWPTLGINLQYEARDGEGPQRPALRRAGSWVFLAKDRSDGLLDLWDRFDRGESPQGDLFGFLGALLASAKDWHDNSYLKLPGYRDRVAEVWLKKGEGGLALDMQREVVDDLIARGKEAGRRLAERFADLPATDAMSWQGHRWVRFRSAMAGLMEALQALRTGVDHPVDGDAPLLDLVDDTVPPPTSPFKSQAQRQEAAEITRALLDLAAKIATTKSCDGPKVKDPEARPFCEGPRPRVEIRTRPMM